MQQEQQVKKTGFFKKFSDFNDSYPWTTWLLLNIGSLVILSTGWYLEVPSIELLGQIIFWFVSIGALFLWGLFEAMKYIIYEKEAILVDMSDEQFKEAERKNKLRNDRILGERRILVNKNMFGRIINRKIPYIFDLGYDMFVVIFLAFIGYAWLPIFYAIHILVLRRIIAISIEITELPTQEIPRDPETQSSETPEDTQGEAPDAEQQDPQP